MHQRIYSGSLYSPICACFIQTSFIIYIWIVSLNSSIKQSAKCRRILSRYRPEWRNNTLVHAFWHGSKSSVLVKGHVIVPKMDDNSYVWLRGNRHPLAPSTCDGCTAGGTGSQWPLLSLMNKTCSIISEKNSVLSPLSSERTCLQRWIGHKT